MNKSYHALVVGLGVLVAASCTSKSESTAKTSASGEVTPQLGGEVKAESGAGVRVPAGSVTEVKTLQIDAESPEVIAATLPENAGQPYAFTPHGTTFESAVTVTVPAVTGATQVLRLDDEQDTTWEVVEGVTIANGVATFQTNHFCVYVAVAKESTGSGGASSTGGSTSAANGGTTAATGGSVSGGTSSIGGASFGGTTAQGGSKSTGGTTANGGTTSVGGTTSTSTTKPGIDFCGTPSDAPTACYTNGMSACSTSISACCADSMCSFALKCTLANVYSESACNSDGSAAAKALFQAVKSCLVSNNAGCPFLGTAV
jgi:hypothetical protein